MLSVWHRRSVAISIKRETGSFSGKKMRKTVLGYCTNLLWACLLLAMVLAVTGCMASQGKTSAEVHQNHMRALNANILGMQDDIDDVGMMDRPLRLNEKTIR